MSRHYIPCQPSFVYTRRRASLQLDHVDLAYTELSRQNSRTDKTHCAFIARHSICIKYKEDRSNRVADKQIHTVNELAACVERFQKYILVRQPV